MRDKSAPARFVILSDKSDDAYLTELRDQLKQLVRDQIVTLWHESDIAAGANRNAEIARHWREADCFIALVSARFLADDRSYSMLKDAAARAPEGGVPIIAVLVSPCDWRIPELKHLQPMPGIDVYLTQRSRAEEWRRIADEVRRCAARIKGASTPNVPTVPTTAKPAAATRRSVPPVRHDVVLLEVTRRADVEKIKTAMALACFGQPGEVHHVAGANWINAKALGPREWAAWFAQTRDFVARLRAQGIDRVYHVIAFAPLPLAFYLGAALGRDRVVVYRTDAKGNIGAIDYDGRTDSTGKEPFFFPASGVPTNRSEAEGRSVLVVSVNSDIESAVRSGLVEVPEQLLDFVHLSTPRPAPGSYRGPVDGPSAVRQMRETMAEMVRSRPRARIQLALDCSVSLAVALGRAANLSALPPLNLLHAAEPSSSYQAVFSITEASPPASRDRRLLGLRAPGPIRVLFVGAQPVDGSPIGVDEELRKIQESLNVKGAAFDIEFHQRHAVRATELQQFLWQLKPDIVHFSSHGKGSTRELVLLSEAGKGQAISNEALAAIFEADGATVGCVLMSACYSEEQALAIHRSVPRAIGLRGPIATEAALAFSSAFYFRMAQRPELDIEGAFRSGIARIKAAGITGTDLPFLVGGDAR